MFTNNYFAYIDAYMRAGSGTFNVKEGGTTNVTWSDLKSVNPLTTAMKNCGWNASGYYSSSGWVAFGKGDTPSTLDDYTLDDPCLNTEITTSAPSNATITNLRDCIEYSGTYGVTALSDVTIKEVGLFANVDTSPNYCALMDRTVLETPITLKKGESKQITYTLRFNKG